MFQSHGSGVRAGQGPTRRAVALGAGAVLVFSGLLAAVPAVASHPEVSLAGSNFEIDTNANLKQDDPSPSIDWASVSEIRKQDSPSGQNDESFGNGSKEDTAVPSVVDGGVPPNKSDLKFFGVHQEGTGSAGFLNLFWSRVQDPSGTTNMDFEFNQSQTASGNGVTPVRSANDLLIQYDLSNGGVNPTISISRWVTSGTKADCEASNTLPCWGKKTLIGGSDAAGSINSSLIAAADADGLGSLDPRTFGEAQLRLSALFPPGSCFAFGSAYLKSRSADTFSSALKDFVPPTPVNITNCGSVRIVKTDDLNAPLAGAEFTLYKDNAPIGGTRGAEDTITTQKCTTIADGTCTIGSVLAGEYWVVETVTPPGHDTAADQHATVVGGVTTPVTLTFVDPRQRGAILVTKTRKHAASGSGNHPQSGVTFTLTGGTTGVTDANGQVCFGNLLFGNYSVTETVPAGYTADGATAKTVAVNNKAACGATPYVGETVAFGNTPLTNLSVSVDSQIDGGTASTIVCTGPNGQVATGSTGSTGDGSATASDLKPGIYTCTIDIDP
ncbi:collagen binding domain-containing protein [Kribbella sp. NPDC056951]|uniref:MSCRAMM family protein n=1 Tax=Kribbella sp. NPDC056951 TaxID=3345978 RepID=UPI003642986D